MVQFLFFAGAVLLVFGFHAFFRFVMPPEPENKDAEKAKEKEKVSK